MSLDDYLQQILDLIEEFDSNKDLVKRLKNVLRIYYLAYLQMLVASEYINPQHYGEYVGMLRDKSGSHFDKLKWVKPSADNHWLSEYTGQVKLNFLNSLSALFESEKKKFSKDYIEVFENLFSLSRTNGINEAGKKIDLSKLEIKNPTVNKNESLSLFEEDILKIAKAFYEAYSDK